MGCGISTPKNQIKKVSPIDSYNTIQTKLMDSGFKVTNVVFALDFANTCKYLHKNISGHRNPFERVLFTLFNFFIKLDANYSIPMYSFGDAVTQDKSVRLMSSTGPTKYTEAEQLYRIYRDSVKYSGPTSYAPIIEEVIRLCFNTKTKDEKMEHYTLVIITDGVTNTIIRDCDALTKAAHYPISIICVGIGDSVKEGSHVNESLKSYTTYGSRLFNNWTFVVYDLDINDNPNKMMAISSKAMEYLPEQYLACKSRGYL